MRLRTRYLLSLIALLAVMTVPVLYGLHRIWDLRGIALELRNHAAGTAVAAGRLGRDLAELDRHIRTYVATTDPAMEHYVAASLDSVGARIATLDQLGYGAYVADERLPLGALRVAADSVRTLVLGGALDGATGHLTHAVRPLLASADSAVHGLSAGINRDTAHRTREAELIATAALATTTTAIVVALLAAVLLAWLSARRLTDPLDRLRRAMGAVADGRAGTQPDPACLRRDELGELFRSFQGMTDRLAQLDRMKAELVSLASHDLKTPISVIIGYAEMIEESGWTADDHHRQVLRSLGDQARALGERLDQLIEISRMEARGLRLGLEEIHVRHFAAGVETHFSPMALRQGVDLAVSVERNAPTFIIADPDCLRSDIVGNLVGHAVRFSPPGSTVRIEFQRGESGLRIVVRDHGPAIPPEHVPFLFEPYFPGSRAEGRLGAGSGLSLARAGVQSHGGTLAVESDETGTRFLLHLPLRPVFGAVQPGTLRPA
jgi:signal transduction histidine kinase